MIRAFADGLTARGHEVVHDYSAADVYVCFDPRTDDVGISGTHLGRIARMRDAKFVCRVGDVGTHGKQYMAKMWLDALAYADRVVFPSRWARNYLDSYLTSNFSYEHRSNVFDVLWARAVIIHNGPMKCFFDARRVDPPDVGSRVKVVTSHWSDNPKKGFELYQELSKCPDVQFTYIGRKPAGIQLQNYVPPLPADKLARELSKHDVYLTASLHEAGANHVLEAMAVGLPVVYHAAGGSIPEYLEESAMVSQEFVGGTDAAVAAIEAIASRMTVSGQSGSYTWESDGIDNVVRRYVDVVEEAVG